VGVLKREIAFSGDVMNTTARIAAHCRESGENSVASGALHNVLAKRVDYTFSTLGLVTLRGKADAM
jgi:adenylate cyclase